MKDSDLFNFNDKKAYEYIDINYRSQEDAQRDMSVKNTQNWEVVSSANSGGLSGGCVGCIGFIPVVIPFGGKKRCRVRYRRLKD
jgi:hypothetical protein